MSFFARLLALVLSLATAAWAEVPGPPGGSTLQRNAERSIGYALGRVRTIEDGQEKTHRPGLFPLNPFDVYVRAVATGKVDRRALEGDGSFAWPLEPGDYEIAGFQAYAPLRVGRIATRFRVAESAGASYVGTLRLEVAGSAYRFAVDDEFDDKAAVLAKGLPAAPPVKALMTLEPPLGRVSDTWPICDARGGLSCDRSLQGVAVVQPTGGERGFPSAGSLAPTLEWSPSPVAALGYDVAIYESIVLNPTPGFTRTLRGPLVAYAEALTEPRWTVEPPLQWNRRYEWSVRLRDGDSVSSWSTSGSIDFLVVGFSSSSGRWFGFSTPKR